MNYLDSSALLKLLFEEPESASLEQWLVDRQDIAVVSSEFARVEVLRATRRLDEARLSAARSLVSQLDLVPLAGPLLHEAAEVGGTHLRTLDALHLASALALGEVLSAFVVYDPRLAAAAAGAGLAVQQPGR